MLCGFGTHSCTFFKFRRSLSLRFQKRFIYVNFAIILIIDSYNWYFIFQFTFCLFFYASSFYYYFTLRSLLVFLLFGIDCFLFFLILICLILLPILSLRHFLFFFFNLFNTFLTNTLSLFKLWWFVFICWNIHWSYSKDSWFLHGLNAAANIKRFHYSNIDIFNNKLLNLILYIYNYYLKHSTLL